MLPVHENLANPNHQRKKIEPELSVTVILVDEIKKVEKDFFALSKAETDIVDSTVDKMISGDAAGFEWKLVKGVELDIKAVEEKKDSEAVHLVDDSKKTEKYSLLSQVPWKNFLLT